MVIFVSIYRLILHPLAKFPGPFFRKISGWPDALSSFYGFRSLDIHQLHKRYGRVVRLAPNLISTIDPDALPAVYGTKCNTKKGPSYLTFNAVNNDAKTILNIRDKKEHATRRRIWQHGFSDKALRSTETFVLENVKRWIDALDKRAVDQGNEELDMAQWCTWLTFDILGDMAYGQGWNLLQDETFRWIPGTIMTCIETIHKISNLPIRPLINPLLSLFRKLSLHSASHFRRYNNLAMSALTRRMAREPELVKDPNRRKDQLYWLLNGADLESGRKLSFRDLHGDSSTLILAGSDTTATALSALIFYLARNPSIQRRLADELRCGLNVTIDGTVHHLPAGTEVGTTLYALHHSSSNHPLSPDAFLPDRWIAGNLLYDNQSGPSITPEYVAQSYRAFQPFSTGQRGCIGKQLALMELSIAVGRLIWGYDVQDVAGWRDAAPEWVQKWEKDMYPVRDWFVSERQGPVVKIERRRAGEIS
ncbi:MAG: hypothetical protein Q9227_005182 [Pyrenula ochraceoflavens]